MLTTSAISTPVVVGIRVKSATGPDAVEKSGNLQLERPSGRPNPADRYALRNCLDVFSSHQRVTAGRFVLADGSGLFRVDIDAGPNLGAIAEPRGNIAGSVRIISSERVNDSGTGQDRIFAVPTVVFRNLRQRLPDRPDCQTHAGRHANGIKQRLKIAKIAGLIEHDNRLERALAAVIQIWGFVAGQSVECAGYNHAQP